MVGLLHGAAAVRDDEKLRVLGEAAHVLHVARNVRLVECSLDLVHDAKRRRPHLQNRKVERDGHERHLAAGHQAQRRERLTGRLHLDLDAAVEHMLRILEHERRLAAAEELQEGLAERLIDRLKLRGEDALHLPRHIGDDAGQLTLGLEDIVPLTGEESVARVHAREFVDRTEVRRAQRADAAAQLGDAAAGLGHVLDRLAQRLGRRAAELVIVPELVEDLLFLHVGRELFLLKARHEPLHIQQVAVARLRIAVGARALSLQLQLTAAARGKLTAQRLGALAKLRQTVLVHLQRLLQMLRAGLRLRDLVKARLAVTGHLLEQVVDLLRGAQDGLALGLKRRRLRPQPGQPVGQLLSAAVKRAAAELALIAFRAKLCKRLLRRGCIGAGGGDALLIRLLLRAAGVNGRILPRDGLLCGVLEQHDLCRLALRPVQHLDRLLQLRLHGVELCVRRVERRLRILELERTLLLFERERIQRLTQALELVGTRQNATALGGTAAGERAAGVDELPVKRDDAVAVVIAPGDGDGVCHRLGDNGAAEEIADDIAVSGRAGDERVGHADIARLPIRHAV